MKVLAQYAAASAGLLALVGTALGLAAGDAARASLLVAAVLVWLFQLGAFALLVRTARDRSAFLVAWAGGLLGRIAVLGVVAFGVSRIGALDPQTLVLATAGFFFGLLIMEPLFLPRTRALAETAS